MLNALVRFSLVNRWTVIAIAALIFAVSVFSLRHAQYDVFPEFAPPQVSIQTEAPGFSAEQVETLITQPIEQAVGGATGVTAMQSSSIQGLSAIQLFFENKTDVFLDRQIISERLSTLSGALPAGVGAPSITPLTSTTNNVLGVGFTSEKKDLAEIRRFVETTVRPQILSVPGVAEAEIFGGLTRQIEIRVRPDMLLKYNLTLDEVANVARKATGIRGGGVIDTAEQRISIESEGQVAGLEAIKALPIVRGTAETIDLAITLGDVADVEYGVKTPFSAASVQGKPGLVLLMTSQYKTNTLEVTRGIEDLIHSLRPQIEAAGITMTDGLIRPASFVEDSVANVSEAMMIGAGLVVVLLVLFLANMKAAFISALSIPLSLGISAALLGYFGFSLDTMTLGGLAIAVGLVVDDAVIDVENMMRRLQDEGGQKLSRFETLLSASLEVRLPVIFATLAVLILALPIIFLPGVAGNLFAPLGYAYALATLLSLFVALTVTPALAMLMLGKKTGGPSIVARALRAGYRGILRAGYPLRHIVYIAALAVVCIAAWFSLQMKTSFVPVLREGHFIVHMQLEPGTSLEKSLEKGIEVSNALLKENFIDKVVQQTGRTEGGIDVWGTNESEFNISLKHGHTESEDVLEQRIEEILSGFDDAEFEIATFLTERMAEVLSGETAQVSLSLFGDDLDKLDTTAAEVLKILEQNPALTNLQQSAAFSAPSLDITLNKDALAQYGLLPTDILDLIQSANQGDIVGQIYDHTPPTDLVLIVSPEHRQTTDQLAALPIRIATGAYIKLSDIAKIETKPLRHEIQRIGGQRAQSILFDIKPHENPQKVLADIEARLKGQAIPNDITMRIDSSFTQAEKTRNDLALFTAAALVAIIILLSFVLPSWRQIGVILILIPLTMSGGVFAVALQDFELSLGAMIGFITLFGISIRNAVILLSHYRHIVEVDGKPWALDTAIEGAVDRLLPIIMTAIITGLGMLPLVLKAGQSGHEIDGPMAQIILGGLTTSTIFTLLVVPFVASHKKFFSINMKLGEA